MTKKFNFLQEIIKSILHFVYLQVDSVLINAVARLNLPRDLLQRTDDDEVCTSANTFFFYFTISKYISEILEFSFRGFWSLFGNQFFNFYLGVKTNVTLK